MNKSRTELLTALADLGQRHPNWRFGQLVANVAGWADQNVWEVEDDQLLAAANDYFQQCEREIAVPKA